jgi:uncharacterized membrane protein YtjA (UPF0391 family)
MMLRRPFSAQFCARSAGTRVASSLGRNAEKARIARKEKPMLYYALIFLLVGLVAGALGLMGVAAVASQISWILFLVGIVMLVIHLVADRGTRIP